VGIVTESVEAAGVPKPGGPRMVAKSLPRSPVAAKAPGSVLLIRGAAW
jgi:hypothetical protein